MNVAEFNRCVERIRFVNRWSWAELATALDLSRVMLFHLRKGTHVVSNKTQKRLEELDRKSVANPDAKNLLQSISERAQLQRIKVTEANIKKGYIDARVEYLTEKPSVAFPQKIRLSRPAVRDSARLISSLMLDEDYDSILLKTLPVDLANDNFLNSLSPFTYRELVAAAMDLVFGLAWKKRLPSPPDKIR